MKKIKTVLFSGLILSMLVLLSGCVPVKDGIPYGPIWDFIGKPMSIAIQYLANDQALGYGVAIIIVTLIVRLLILPLGIYQSWKATYQSEKMRYLQPILGPIQERMRNASTQEEQLAAQQEYFATQKEYGVSLFGGIGCLPLLIQMPFFSSLFIAARYTEGIADADFMGISLGERSLILIAIAVALYTLQSLLMTVGVSEEQKKQMKSMLWLNPITIVIVSWSSPAGVTLYWVVGGVIGLFQQAIISFFLKPTLRKKIDQEFEQNPPKPLHTSTRVKDVTPSMDQAISTPNKKKNRNAGKQRSR